MTCGKPCQCPSYREHLLSVGIGGSPEVQRIESSERVLRQDLDAYKRLRGQGLQPRSHDGAAHLERHAVTAAEVESGVIREDIARSMGAGRIVK